ncbi:heterogeneous nuclear ribonucleoprotein H [Platysternon megacephalum]|uniref:Heterogeneous nuclear ribonucleoprotein H n=1 Tax=Platysternon megacephalum TaxID=55544 RepID=A0A4D9EIQ0_9SAUR|nr:heterogeneous nuclear ribonucleoprotein H [Platysternon megacephalum]
MVFFLINYLKCVSFNLQVCILLFIITPSVCTSRQCLLNIYSSKYKSGGLCKNLKSYLCVVMCSEARIKINALGKYLSVPDPNTQTLFFSYSELPYGSHFF